MATQRFSFRHPYGGGLSRAALRWVAPVAWAVVLLWLGQQKGDDLPDSPLWELPGGDKLAHAGAYAVLGALTAWAAGLPPQPRALSRAVGWGLAAALVVGLLDEWGQASTPDREASMADVAADLVGGALGAALSARFGPRLIPRRKG